MYQMLGIQRILIIIPILKTSKIGGERVGEIQGEKHTLLEQICTTSSKTMEPPNPSGGLDSVVPGCKFMTVLL